MAGSVFCLEAGDAGVVVLDHLMIGRGAGLLGGVEEFVLHVGGKAGPVGWRDADILNGLGELAGFGAGGEGGPGAGGLLGVIGAGLAGGTGLTGLAGGLTGCG